MTTLAQEGRLHPLPRPVRSHQRNLNLVRELAITQFKLRYAGSVLGYVWSLVKPLMLFGILYLVFVRLLKVKADEFPVQLLLGVVIWNFFTEATSTAVNAIAGQAGLVRKAYFPRWILVVASTASAMLTFLINLVLVVAVTVAIGHMHLGVRSLLAPLFLLELIALIMGLSLLLSSVFVYFRDVGHIWEIISLALFYGSAILFPFTIVPAGDRVLRLLIGVNPVAQVVEDLRHAMVVSTAPWMASVLGSLYAVPILIVVAVFTVGWLTFHRLGSHFAENL